MCLSSAERGGAWGCDRVQPKNATCLLRQGTKSCDASAISSAEAPIEMAATLPALLVTTVASTMSYALVFPTLAPLLKQLGGGSGGGGGGGGGDGGGASRWLGVAVAVFSATKILAAPPVGALTQSVGWRPTLLILMAVLVGANAWYALSTSIASVIAARGLIGIASCSSTCCRTAIVQHGGTKEQRARSTALLSAASTFGFIAGPASGGLLSLSPSIPWLRLRAPGWLGCALGGFTLLLVALSCPTEKSEASDGMNDPLRSALAADSSGAQQGGGVESQSESSMSRTDSRTDSLHASRDGATARDTLDLTPPRTPERLPFPQSPDTGSGAGDRHAASPNPTPMWRLALTNSMAGRQQQSQQQPREPRRSPTGFVVLCLVQLVATSPFASIETLITPFVSSAFGFNTLAIGLLFAGGSFTTLLVTGVCGGHLTS